MLDGFKNKDYEIGSILLMLFNFDFKVYNIVLVWIWFFWFILIKNILGENLIKDIIEFKNDNIVYCMKIVILLKFFECILNIYV